MHRDAITAIKRKTKLLCPIKPLSTKTWTHSSPGCYWILPGASTLRIGVAMRCATEPVSRSVWEEDIEKQGRSLRLDLAWILQTATCLSEDAKFQRTLYLSSLLLSYSATSSGW